MTHFIGAVLVPAGLGDVSTSPTKYPGLYGEDALETTPDKALNAYLAEALEPFNENREVEAYVETDEDWEKELADAKRFHKEHAGQKQNSYSDSTYESLSDLEGWSDQKYLDSWSGAGVWKPRASGVGFDKWSTYNPQSRWDWWTIGGRWEEGYRDLQGQSVDELVKRIDAILAARADEAEMAKLNAALEAWKPLEYEYRTEFEDSRKEAWEAVLACAAFIPWSFPYSVVHPVDDGEGSKRPEWTEKGKMGWFGFHDDKHSDESWLQELKAIGEANGGAKLYYIDFHI